MADAYWRYGQARQPQQQSIPTLVGKRSRSDYDVLGGHELHNYYPRDDDRGALRAARDSDSIGASYDRYLRSGPISSYSGGQSARPISGVPSHPVDDLRAVGIGSLDPGATVKERTLGLGSGRPEAALPPDASSTLFVEGLPSDCTRREVAHIFRPFVGYKEVRLVSKESRRPGGDPLVLCFVDFLSPAHAATALDALQATGLSIREKIFPRVMDEVETKASLLSDPTLWRHIKPTSPIPLLHYLSYSGYKFDEHDRDLVHLRLQFARYPGARSGGGHRGKR